jgi:hypothetical protein
MHRTTFRECDNLQGVGASEILTRVGPRPGRPNLKQPDFEQRSALYCLEPRGLRARADWPTLLLAPGCAPGTAAAKDLGPDHEGWGGKNEGCPDVRPDGAEFACHWDASCRTSRPPDPERSPREA